MGDESNQNSYSEIIALIFKNAQESIKDLDDEIKGLNTQLGSITGFSAALIKLAGDLPDRSIILIDSLPCNSCSILKISSLILLSVSILISLTGLLPKNGGEDNIISPTEQFEKWGSNLKRDRLQVKLFGFWSFERSSWCWQGSHARDNPEK
jgi:hypothetical protein